MTSLVPARRAADGRRRPPARLSPNLPDSAIAQFKANPQGLLTTYASAGLPLSTEVRSLVLTDPSLVDALITVAKSANDAQKAAIGAGLAEAARIIVATDPKLAAQIQVAVAQSGLQPLITAYIAGSNATVTAATGGGGRRWRRRRRTDWRRRQFHRIEHRRHSRRLRWRRQRGFGVRLDRWGGRRRFRGGGGPNDR